MLAESTVSTALTHLPRPAAAAPAPRTAADSRQDAGCCDCTAAMRSSAGKGGCQRRVGCCLVVHVQANNVFTNSRHNLGAFQMVTESPHRQGDEVHQA